MTGVSVDYTSIAESYDENRFCDFKGSVVNELDRGIVRSLVLQSGAIRVLDAPTGTGRVISYLRDLPIELTACDLTSAMLEQAKAKAGDRSVEFIQSNIADVPRSSETFDCIVCLRFFHLFSPLDRGPFVKEFERLLKPGGHLICSFTNGWYGGGINWIKRLLGVPSVQFLYPGELRTLFPGWTVRAVRGNFFPLHWLMAKCGVNPLLKALGRTPLFRRLCWETFFLLEKPA